MTWQAWALLCALLMSMVMFFWRERKRRIASRRLHDFLSELSEHCYQSALAPNDRTMRSFLLGKSVGYAFGANATRRALAGDELFHELRSGPNDEIVNELQEIANSFRVMAKSHEHDATVMREQRDAVTDAQKRTAASLMANGFGGIVTGYNSAAEEVEDRIRCIQGQSVAIREKCTNDTEWSCST